MVMSKALRRWMDRKGKVWQYLGELEGRGRVGSCAVALGKLERREWVVVVKVGAYPCKEVYR